ncbi:MAG: M23 family metallopeptidase [Anaerolineaceae bacterium]|nr:M23 family metallopeptidase [Anaerolineaceae bacterium]
MIEQRKEISSEGLGEQPDPLQSLTEEGNFWQKAWARLEDLDLSSGLMRFAGVLFTCCLILVFMWVMNRFYTSVRGTKTAVILAPAQSLSAKATEEAMLPAIGGALSQQAGLGLARDATLHTILPSYGRFELSSYTVEPGDTLFSIAQKFNLRTETLLWGNLYTIGDDPHTIYPGQQLTILPVDGTLHKWSAGEGLNAVSEHFHVKPEDIINYPGNHLDPKSVGDFSNPQIKPGTLLIIPGGYADFPDWRTPRITRKDPATAKNVGPGACEGSYDGVVGSGNFIWPTEKHYLSGYDYDPGSNHYGIDIAGEIGEKVKAADNGVVVYAGLNDWGYGLMVVIDHGEGWQSLYAHLEKIDVKCGQEVYSGDKIGSIGDTGMAQGGHLHFELRSDNLGRVNPKNYLK